MATAATSEIVWLGRLELQVSRDVVMAAIRMAFEKGSVGVAPSADPRVCVRSLMYERECHSDI
jgi:hypothetical protein